MGYSPLRAGVGFIPFVIAMAHRAGASSKLVSRFPPRVVVIAGGILLLGAMLYGSARIPRHALLPEPGMPIVVGGIGIGMVDVPLTLSRSPASVSTRSARHRR